MTLATIKTSKIVWEMINQILFSLRKGTPLYFPHCFQYIFSFSGYFVTEQKNYFKITSLAMGQMFDCPSTSHVNLNDIGKDA